LIGYGRLAQAVAGKALPFGLRVMAYTPRLIPTERDKHGVHCTNQLEFLLQQADYLSLHVPLSPETRGLINAERLRQMKPTAVLINTARGAVIDEEALLTALRQGWIAGAMLDVLSQEPPPPEHPLLALDNVIVTPHAAFYSTSATAELARRAAEQVAQVLLGQLPTHVVNPTVLASPQLRLPLSKERVRH